MSLRTALAAMLVSVLTLAIVIILTGPRTDNTVPVAALQPVPTTVTVERMVPIVVPPTTTTAPPTTAARGTRKAHRPARVKQTPLTPSKTRERLIKTENGDYVPESFYKNFDPSYRPPSKSKVPTTSREIPTSTTSRPPPTSTASKPAPTGTASGTPHSPVAIDP